MKKAIVAILSLLIFISCCPAKNGSTSQPTTAALNRIEVYNLDTIVKTVQKQYECAINKLEKKENIRDIEITSAKLTLKVAQSISGGGELTVLIFGASGSIEKSYSTTVSFTLAKKDTSGGFENALADDDNKLCDLIVEAAKKFHNLKRTVGDLEKDSFDLDTSFSIVKKGGGKVTFEIWGIGAEVGGEQSGTIEHGLSLTFKPKK